MLGIEEAALAAELRSSPAQIGRRLAAFPEGQLVAERDGEVIGVVYTQRIAHPDALRTVAADEVETLHQTGGAAGQLLGFLVHPERRDRIDAEENAPFRN